MNAYKKPDVISTIEVFCKDPKIAAETYKNHPEADLGAAFLFSARLENQIAEENEQMRAWSESAWEIIAEEMPDVCAEVEPGDELEPFAEKIRDIYERAMKAAREP